jgi:hypothetical protein
MTRLLLVGLVTSAIVLIAILSLIRTRRLQERFALLWILAAMGVLVFALWPGALNRLAKVTGISYGPSALFLLASIFGLGVLLQSTVMISRLSHDTQQLAQHIALLDERLRRAETGAEPGPDAVPSARRESTAAAAASKDEPESLAAGGRRSQLP